MSKKNQPPHIRWNPQPTGLWEVQSEQVTQHGHYYCDVSSPDDDGAIRCSSQADAIRVAYELNSQNEEINQLRMAL
jgi:hypothetical protein